MQRAAPCHLMAGGGRGLSPWGVCGGCQTLVLPDVTEMKVCSKGVHLSTCTTFWELHCHFLSWAGCLSLAVWSITSKTIKYITQSISNAANLAH